MAAVGETGKRRERWRLLDWLNLVGVVVGIIAAIPITISAIRVAGVATSTYDLLVTGKRLEKIYDAQREAIAQVQKAGLTADIYHFRMTRDSALNPAYNNPALRNVDEAIDVIGRSLRDGEVGCRRQPIPGTDVLYVQKGNYTSNGSREIIGVSLAQLGGAGFSGVTTSVYKADEKYVVLWFFNCKLDWILITDGANSNAPFEFRSDITVFTKPILSK